MESKRGSTWEHLKTRELFIFLGLGLLERVVFQKMRVFFLNARCQKMSLPKSGLGLCPGDPIPNCLQ